MQIASTDLGRIQWIIRIGITNSSQDLRLERFAESKSQEKFQCVGTDKFDH